MTTEPFRDKGDNFGDVNVTQARDDANIHNLNEIDAKKDIFYYCDCLRIVF